MCQLPFFHAEVGTCAGDRRRVKPFCPHLIVQTGKITPKLCPIVIEAQLCDHSLKGLLTVAMKEIPCLAQAPCNTSTASSIWRGAIDVKLVESRVRDDDVPSAGSRTGSNPGTTSPTKIQLIAKGRINPKHGSGLGIVINYIVIDALNFSA